MTRGFSCGVFHKLQEKSEDRFSPDVMQKFVTAGANAVELMCHTTEHLAYICKQDLAHIAQFRHISVHAPAYTYDDDEQSHELLRAIVRLCGLLQIDYVVFHPDKVQNWEVISQYNIPIAIENMDERKEAYRSHESVGQLLQKYPFGLVIDLQHCFANDPTMQLAKNLHMRFADRLVGYHISAYDQHLLHVPLFERKQNMIIDAVERTDIPMIIESAFMQFGDEKCEMRYIAEHINI